MTLYILLGYLEACMDHVSLAVTVVNLLTNSWEPIIANVRNELFLSDSVIEL